MQKKGTEHASETIVQYLMDSVSDETYVDFVAVGNNGCDVSAHSSAHYLGSVASGVIKKSNLNVLFIA